MVYESGSPGRVASEGSDAGRVSGERIFYTFDMVEEMLVDAVALWMRSPDRERGWHHVRAFWPEVRRHPWWQTVGGETDHPEAEPELRQLPLTRAQVAERDAVSDWLRFVPERDRKLVTLALACLAAGEARVPWMKLKAKLGVRFGADGLRKRYSRALTGIANALNA